MFLAHFAKVSFFASMKNGYFASPDFKAPKAAHNSDGCVWLLRADNQSAAPLRPIFKNNQTRRPPCATSRFWLLFGRFWCFSAASRPQILHRAPPLYDFLI